MNRAPDISTKSTKEVVAGNRVIELRRMFQAPVNTITGYVELMLEDARRQNLGAAMADLNGIAEASRQALAVINDHLSTEEAATVSGPIGGDALPREVRHELRQLLHDIQRHGTALKATIGDLRIQALGTELNVLLDEAKQLLSHVDGGVGTAPHGLGPVQLVAAQHDPTYKAPDSLQDVEASRHRDTGRILVVDDIPSNRLLLSRRLSRDGHEVIEAEGGIQALEILKQQEIDVVLLDLVMPDMDGYQVLRAIKSDEDLRDVRVIMVSGEQETEAVLRCIEAEAEDYLSKPVDPVLLNARIGACLERKRWRDRELSYLRQLEEEKKNSEALLLNILPDKIIHRMKRGENVIADRHDDVSVLFADIVDFTKFSARISATDVVADLNRLFSAFDALILERGLEKVKTIGDAYMVAAGLEDGQTDHVDRAAETALDMIDILKRTVTSEGVPWRMRIGVHCGSVVAGVIGTHKFVYDVWGDTVNVASRIESFSKPNRILVSREFAERLDDRYDTSAPGKTFVHGNGDIETVFLARRDQEKGRSRP